MTLTRLTGPVGSILIFFDFGHAPDSVNKSLFIFDFGRFVDCPLNLITIGYCFQKILTRFKGPVGSSFTDFKMSYNLSFTGLFYFIFRFSCLWLHNKDKVPYYGLGFEASIGFNDH